MLFNRNKLSLNNITLMNFIPCFNFLLPFQIKNLANTLFENNLLLEQDRFESIYETISSFNFK